MWLFSIIENDLTIQGSLEQTGNNQKLWRFKTLIMHDTLSECIVHCVFIVLLKSTKISRALTECSVRHSIMQTNNYKIRIVRTPQKKTPRCLRERQRGLIMNKIDYWTGGAGTAPCWIASTSLAFRSAYLAA